MNLADLCAMAAEFGRRLGELLDFACAALSVLQEKT